MPVIDNIKVQLSGLILKCPVQSGNICLSLNKNRINKTEDN